MPCDDTGRDWSDAAVSQRVSRIANNPQEQEEARKILLERLWGSLALPTPLFSDFQPPESRE